MDHDSPTQFLRLIERALPASNCLPAINFFLLG
jgi:hypothetical protein